MNVKYTYPTPAPLTVTIEMTYEESKLLRTAFGGISRSAIRNILGGMDPESTYKITSELYQKLGGAQT